MRRRRSHFQDGEGPRAQRLIALWLAGCAVFNFPLLLVWDRDATLAGLPLFPILLFALWAVLIGLLAWTVERGAD